MQTAQAQKNGSLFPFRTFRMKKPCHLCPEFADPYICLLLKRYCSVYFFSDNILEYAPHDRYADSLRQRYSQTLIIFKVANNLRKQFLRFLVTKSPDDAHGIYDTVYAAKRIKSALFIRVKFHRSLLGGLLKEFSNAE